MNKYLNWLVLHRGTLKHLELFAIGLLIGVVVGKLTRFLGRIIEIFVELYFLQILKAVDIIGNYSK